MVHANKYSTTERLPDGRTVEIRALKPGDRDGLLAAVDRTSAQSLYRRFFSFKRSFSDREINFYVDVDFESHVALAALLQVHGQPVLVGGARYIVVEPGQAEVAFTVDDAHQGLGIGAALLRHLAVIAHASGLKELVAHVLPENRAMLKVFEKSGLKIVTRRQPDVVHVILELS